MENLRFAFRYLLKLRGSNLTRVVSLSLGLAVGLLLFSYSYYQITFDRCFRDGDRIWQMWSVSDKFGVSSSLYAPLAPALAAEIPQLEAATRLSSSHDEVVRGDNSFPMFYLYADTMFFDVFGFEVLRGDPKQILSQDEEVMLSESAAKKIFGDKDPLGQQILLKGTDPLTVSGIFRDPPANQHLGKFTMLRSFESVKKYLYTGWNGGDSFRTYFKLLPEVSIGQIEAQLPAFCERHRLCGEDSDDKFVFHPIADASKIASPTALVAWILMALAALALFVAAMNYVLISVSTLVSRSRTIAMLKVGGARRRDIFAVFCWETALLTATSVVVAVFLIWGFQNQIEQITATSVGELFAFERIWVPLCVILAAFALAALIPAQLFTSIPVTLAFRGAAVNRRRWKQVLLFVEVLSVTLVAVLLLVFFMQFDRLRNGDFGFEHDRLVYTRLNVPFERIGAICDEVASLPEVESVGGAEDLPLWGFSGQPCFDENTRELLFSCRYLICGDGFIPTMNMQMVAGRNFTPVSSGSEAIVNETYLRMRGWKVTEAVGRQIVDNDSPDPDPYTIVGVVRDFRTSVIDGRIEPIVLHPVSHALNWGFSTTDKIVFNLLIRLRELTPEALAAVRQKIREYPTDSNYVVEAYDNDLAQAFSDIRSYRNIVLVVSCIVLLIALTGLIGYLSDEIRRRSKEVAIRKVNGASAGSVVRLLSREIALLCLPAIATGLALGYWCSGMILSMFVERIALRWWIFALCALAVTLVVVAVQIGRTWRIANSNPIGMIKTE